MRWLLAMFAALSLLGCEKRWTTPVADIACGSMRLRFEERGRDTGWPSGAISYTPVLLRDDGREWKIVDARGWNLGPDAYAWLLPPGTGYRSFRVYEIGTYDWHILPWVIYADPSSVSRAEYGAIGDCIGSNLAAIDAAFDKATPDRRHRISSTLNVPYDSPLLTVRWNCPNGKSIRTEAPDLLVLSDRSGSSRYLGRITSKGRIAQLYAPAKDFYAQCRDASGHSFYEGLNPSGR